MLNDYVPAIALNVPLLHIMSHERGRGRFKASEQNSAALKRRLKHPVALLSISLRELWMHNLLLLERCLLKTTVPIHFRKLNLTF